jgi:hypothetical protein
MKPPPNSTQTQFSESHSMILSFFTSLATAATLAFVTATPAFVTESGVGFIHAIARTLDR